MESPIFGWSEPYICLGSAVTFEITLNIDEDQFNIQHCIIRRYCWKRKEKTCWTGALLCYQNNCKIYERSARMEGNQRSADSQVQQLTQKNSSTPHLKNTKLEEKGKTVEGWKYPTSPGSFPEICVRSRTITVWNESDHWLKLILEREFLFSTSQQLGIKIPIGYFWQ